MFDLEEQQKIVDSVDWSIFEVTDVADLTCRACNHTFMGHAKFLMEPRVSVSRKSCPECGNYILRGIRLAPERMVLSSKDMNIQGDG